MQPVGPGAGMTEIDAQQAETVKPLVARFRPMRIALLVYIAGEAGLAIIGLLEYIFRTTQGIDPYTDLGPGSAIFAIGGLVAGLSQLGGLVASVILVSMWTYRAMKNLHVVKAPAATMSPGWAVGWHFIPIANLWKPFEGMLQIWRESHRLAGRSEKVAAYVGWWWATWLISNGLANLSLRLSGFVEPLPTYNAGLIVGVVASGLSIVCGFLLLRTASQVTQMQAEMRMGGLADTFS